ncbi:glycosyltransferase [Frankia casuarinae]|uniref:Glycosyl transferase, group 1 n=1 Tax=Frankia casuarinae (strain DSM 45818 / CECT 9043 / HFP020203 / CcI3) TaxID=106370 RepID=Q2JF27_FRACC|nr:MULTISPECIES: glycosyltransferase family 4 protein [Frankia]ABD10115.1 glycosyl transferase, group 1 [Frankia casuarinae]ETA04139.1 glycosyltransferase [Frankia sp. CcI6]EYT94016.1 glycosyltransferase [Frankia casuarinae]KDA44641.1 glycosyltransferase [Frankia sp. BMG5.23]KEZ38513.1 glycosyltransferase [Frankia sp. CeD]
MRIAIVGPTHPYKGGIAQHTTELAHRLSARGHEVAVESWSAQYPARLYPGVQRVTEPEMEPFEVTRYPLSWRRPDGWIRLGRRLRRQADAVILVVVTPVQAPAYLGVLGALRARGPRGRGTASGRAGSGGADPGGAGPTVVALCHNVLPHERRAVDEPLTSAVLRRSSAVLVHTPAQAELAARLTPAPVLVAEMATHLWSSALSSSPPGPVAGRGGPSADVTRRNLLFFGLVRPYKGLDVLLRALARGPADVRLTVAGEFWGGTGEIARLVEELGLATRVDLRSGYVDAAEVPALFAGADALVLPYRAGTASQNVGLAHLHGVPVVATTVGTLATTVRDGVDGLLVPPDDAEALAVALRRLYEPGVLAGLRSKVIPPDVDGAWERYLDVTLGALGRT